MLKCCVSTKFSSHKVFEFIDSTVILIVVFVFVYWRFDIATLVLPYDRCGLCHYAYVLRLCLTGEIKYVYIQI